MDAINDLRIELAESLETLPVALHSSFPDLGVDFLYHVFSDVLDKDDNPAFRRAKRARTTTQRTHNVTHAEAPLCSSPSNQTQRVTRSSKRLRSLSNTTIGENTDSEDDATTDRVVEKDSKELKEAFERALEHIDRIKVESARLEEAALSVGARKLVNAGPVRLVRCMTCGKTVGSHAMRTHKALCQEANTQNTASGAYTNDTASEMNGQPHSTAIAIKSNIAPIKTKGSGGNRGNGGDLICGASGDLPLSPIAISLKAQSARQLRSFQGVPNLKLELPVMSPMSPMSPRTKSLHGYFKPHG